MSVVALITALTLSVSQEGQRCGTVHLTPAVLSQLSSGKLAGTVRASAMSGRSVDAETPSLSHSEHFTIAWMPAQANSRNSISSAMSGIAVGDSLPEAIRLSLNSLESAWRLYVDTMGMRAPLPYETSWHWGVAPMGGRYVIEFLQTDNVNFSGMIPSGSFYYGLTMPRGEAGQSSMAAVANWTDSSKLKPWSYLPDTANVPEHKIGHDFVKDWREGLIATLVHELFHACQFRYDRSLSHFFFEASAVGMEERSAPWTQDWLYYTPGIYGVLPELTSVAYGKLYMYGEGLWVQSLVQDCGDGYQARFWKDREERSGDVFQTMSRTLATGCNGNFEHLLGRHALRLMGAGRRSDWLPARENGQALQGFRLARAMPALLHDTTDVLTEIVGNMRAVPKLSPRYVRLAPHEKPIAVSLGSESVAALVAGSATGIGLHGSQMLLPASEKEQWIGVVNALNGVQKMWLGLGEAPAPDSLSIGLPRSWKIPGGTLTGTVAAGQGSRVWGCQSCWMPSGQDGLVTISDTSRILRVHDFSGSLRLKDASIVLDRPDDSLENAYVKLGDTPWTAVSTSWEGGVQTLSLGQVDFAQPLTILLGASLGAGSGSMVGRPYPNPARLYHANVKFPVQIWAPGSSVTIWSADGTILAKLIPKSDQNVVEWELKTGSGRRIRPGMYFYRWIRARGAQEGRIIVAE